MSPEHAPLDPAVTTALLTHARTAMVGRLLRGMVHNFSGALQAVRLPLDLLELQLSRGPVEVGPKLAAVQQGVTRLNQELDILAMQSQVQQRLVDEDFPLGELVSHLIALWRGDMYFKHETELVDQVSSRFLRVHAAPGDVALALDALLANAVESLQASELRRLSLEPWEEDGLAGIKVEDEGPGPDAAMAPRLFQPFATDKAAPHAGLGLYLAARAVEPWGGRVRRLGQTGAAFTLLLPLAG